MKTLSLILVVIGCVAFLHGVAYAESSSQESRQKPAENNQRAVTGHPDAAKPAAADEVEDFSAEDKLLHRTRVGGRPSNKTGRVSHSAVTKVAPKQPTYHPKPLEKSLAGSRAKNTPGYAPVIYKPGSRKLDGGVRTASKPALAEKEKNHPVTLAARSRDTVPLGGSTFRSLRGRSPEPAVVGGALVSTARTTAAISGNSFRNRTY
jgi:hypothetical protein